MNSSTAFWYRALPCGPDSFRGGGLLVYLRVAALSMSPSALIVFCRCCMLLRRLVLDAVSCQSRYYYRLLKLPTMPMNNGCMLIG